MQSDKNGKVATYVEVFDTGKNHSSVKHKKLKKKKPQDDRVEVSHVSVSQRRCLISSKLIKESK